ncbi:TetR/AcrR family transcriptional regulator [Amycolatopsis anabasis]|uniref:TetR/AcrR family transcriptional regulator n=1 Tax=Amycolatopsis anabasis TaxID=1840409 RepID=UPI001FE35870|nr:TetR/AcrR family transcriptional regulator [Amycolatopsis anabasis]
MQAEGSSVWTRPRRRRRDQPSLTREQIVAGALRLLDAEGVDGLSMRKLGTELGAVATAVYWHVTNKDELIELVIDEVYGEIEVPEIDDPAAWRDAVAGIAHSLRSTFLRHPWFASVIDAVGLSYLGPKMMRVSDQVLALFVAGGFSLAEADLAWTTVSVYVMGIASTEAATVNRLSRTGEDEEEHLRSILPIAEEASQEYPRLRQLYAEARARGSAAGVREDKFAYGLERILDGLQARLA